MSHPWFTFRISPEEDPLGPAAHPVYISLNLELPPLVIPIKYTTSELIRFLAPAGSRDGLTGKRLRPIPSMQLDSLEMKRNPDGCTLIQAGNEIQLTPTEMNQLHQGAISAKNAAWSWRHQRFRRRKEIRQALRHITEGEIIQLPGMTIRWSGEHILVAYMTGRVSRTPLNEHSWPAGNPGKTRLLTLNRRSPPQLLPNWWREPQESDVSDNIKNEHQQLTGELLRQLRITTIKQEGALYSARLLAGEEN